MSLAIIEQQTKDFADQYSKLEAEIAGMEQEMQQIKRSHLNIIRKYADRVREKREVLKQSIVDNATLFEKPRSYIFHGIKVGMQKGRGTMDFDNEVTIRLIKKHLPEKADSLIKIEERVIKKALETVPANDLKKIAVHITEAQDEPLIKSTASDIEKLVDGLIKEDESDLKLVKTGAA